MFQQGDAINIGKGLLYEALIIIIIIIKRKMSLIILE